MMAMLEFYYDDSGTHADSDVVVWGGVAGHVHFMNELSAAWNAQLATPCEGRPPIKKFHSVDLMHGWGEFEGYSEPERNLTRRNFRKIILDAGLSVLSYGIAAKAWHEELNGVAKIALRSPEHTILSLAVAGGCEAAIKEKMPVAFVFDAGCATRTDIPLAVANGIELAKIDPDLVSSGISPVMGNAGLQAADLVAHETYRLFCDFLATGQANPEPHLARLRDGAHDFQARWIGRNEITNMIAEFNAAMTLRRGE